MIAHPLPAETSLMTVHIRPARLEDAGRILELIIELADYERARHEVVANLADIERSLFSPEATAKALICERDGQVIGYAVYFFSYSTWLGSNGIYLEDLYITPTNAVAAQASSCCAISPEKPATRGAAAWSGAYWTGTNPPFSSTARLAHSLRMSGCATGWKARPCTRLRAATAKADRALLNRAVGIGRHTQVRAKAGLNVNAQAHAAHLLLNTSANTTIAPLMGFADLLPARGAVGQSCSMRWMVVPGAV